MQRVVLPCPCTVLALQSLGVYSRHRVVQRAFASHIGEGVAYGARLRGRLWSHRTHFALAFGGNIRCVMQ